MATVGDLTTKFNVTDQTIRSWAKEFERHLSPKANPPKGEARIFSDEDLVKLALVATMRQDRATAEAIHQALDNDEWKSVVLDDGAPGGSSELTVTFELEIARYQGRLAEVEKQRNEYLQELREERSRYAHLLVDAQRLERLEQEANSLREAVAKLTQQEREAFERAVRAEAELEVLKRPTEPPATPQPPVEQRAAVVPEEPKRKSWLSRLMGR